MKFPNKCTAKIQTAIGEFEPMQKRSSFTVAQNPSTLTTKLKRIPPKVVVRYWLIDWYFYAAFNSISVISRRQLTLLMSFLGFTSTGLGSEVSCLRTLPRKKPAGSNAARTQDPWITSQTLYHWATWDPVRYWVYSENNAVRKEWHPVTNVFYVNSWAGNIVTFILFVSKLTNCMPVTDFSVNSGMYLSISIPINQFRTCSTFHSAIGQDWNWFCMWGLACEGWSCRNRIWICEITPFQDFKFWTLSNSKHWQMTNSALVQMSFDSLL